MKRKYDDKRPVNFDYNFFKPFLNRIENPTALYLRKHVLNSTGNVFGMNHDSVRNKNSFLHWLVCEKQKFPNCIILVQVGEFFELVGIDAILAVEYGGLRAMGTVPTMKAGTPLKGIQRLLDSLVTQNLNIRVYEECHSVDTSKKTYKKREFTQFVSKYNPVYHKHVINLEDLTDFVPRFIMYVLDDDIIIVNIMKCIYFVFSDISKKTLNIYVNIYRPYEIHCVSQYRSCIKKNTDVIIKHLDSFKMIKTLIQEISKKYGLTLYQKKLDYERRPIANCTLKDIGIDFDNHNNMPRLLKFITGSGNYMETQFLTDWIRIKPSNTGRLAMENLCHHVLSGHIKLNKLPLLNPTYIYGILNVCKCSDIYILNKIRIRLNERIISPYLHTVACEYLGTRLDMEQTNNDATSCSEMISTYLSTYSTNIEEQKLPFDFIKRNEQHVLESSVLVHVLQYRQLICKEIERINGELPEYTELHYSSVDNDLTFVSRSNVVGLVNSYGKKGKRKYNWTTPCLEENIDKYKKYCKAYRFDQFTKIKMISKHIIDTYGDIVVHYLQSDVILNCVYHHLSHIIKFGWNKCTVVNDATGINIKGLFPYWLNEKDASTNDILINKGETILLTSPNSHGKTTIIRTVMIVNILGNCGLYVPAEYANIPNINNFILRLPSLDKPNKDLSSFQVELLNLQWYLDNLNELSSNTIIFFDEFGSSTNPVEGMSLCRSVLEYVAKRKCFCIFSTHFLEMVSKFDTSSDDYVKMTINHNHKIAIGSVDSSMALHVCKRMGICDEILGRMEEIQTSEYKKNDTNALLESDLSINRTSTTILEIAFETIGFVGTLVIYDKQIPPHFTKTHCVYIINEGNNIWYCGETKNIIKRRQQHETAGRVGDIYIYKISDKTTAMQYETSIIKKCLKHTIQLSSYSDGFHYV